MTAAEHARVHGYSLPGDETAELARQHAEAVRREAEEADARDLARLNAAPPSRAEFMNAMLQLHERLDVLEAAIRDRT